MGVGDPRVRAPAWTGARPTVGAAVDALGPVVVDAHHVARRGLGVVEPVLEQLPKLGVCCTQATITVFILLVMSSTPLLELRDADPFSSMPLLEVRDADPFATILLCIIPSSLVAFDAAGGVESLEVVDGCMLPILSLCVIDDVGCTEQIGAV